MALKTKITEFEKRIFKAVVHISVSKLSYISDYGLKTEKQSEAAFSLRYTPTLVGIAPLIKKKIATLEVNKKFLTQLENFEATKKEKNRLCKLKRTSENEVAVKRIFEKMMRQQSAIEKRLGLK